MNLKLLHQNRRSTKFWLPILLPIVKAFTQHTGIDIEVSISLAGRIIANLEPI